MSRPRTAGDPSWRDEYLAALTARDEREQANAGFIDAYTQLADRTAALETEKAAGQFTSSSTATTRAPPANGSSDEVARLRSDLAEAIRAKGQLLGRLKTAETDLEKYIAKNKVDSKAVKDLTAERAILMTKVRDRDEELRGKAKLLEVDLPAVALLTGQDVQDEMISLNLQMNVAEERAKKFQKENKELIDRWMARMGQEADAMNNASRYS